MKIWIAIFYSLTLIIAVIATDYCKIGICKKGTRHIACHNEGKFSANCPSDAGLREMTEPLKKFIVEAHNEKRNIIAGGGGDSLKPACHMATMEWDDELASLAKLNVMQCKMKHDKCHNTETFQFSGQSLSSISFSGAVNDRENIQKAIDLWFQEKRDVQQNIIDKFSINQSGPDTGHFTVMMADRNIRLGCAAAVYSSSDKNFKEYLFACNYAANNMIGFPIYKSCEKPAEDCKSGTNPTYKNLCSTSESYDVNKY